MGSLLLTFGVLTLLAPPVESHEPTTATHPLGRASAKIQHPGHEHVVTIDPFFGGNLTTLHPKHFEIQWIRVYKNPATMSLDELRDPAAGGVDPKAGTVKFVNFSGPPTSYVVTPPGFSRYRRARLFTSLNATHQDIVSGKKKLEDVKDEFFWVKIKDGDDPSDPTSGGLEDTGDNSGLVTATENTVVAPGDIVAIAVNVKLTYYKGVYDWVDPSTRRMGTGERNDGFHTARVHDPTRQPITPGNQVYSESLEIVVPLGFKPGQRGPDKDRVWVNNLGWGNIWQANAAPGRDHYTVVVDFNERARLDQLAGGAIIAAMHLPVVGTLNPNYPLEHVHHNNNQVTFDQVDRSRTHKDLQHEGMDGYHTLVYQFEVTEAHLGLNAEGEWLKRRGGHVNPFNMPYSGAPLQEEYAWATFGPEPPTGSLHQERFGFWVTFLDSDAHLRNPNGNRGKELEEFLDPTKFIENAPYTLYYRHRSAADENFNSPALNYEGPAIYGRDLFDPNDDGILDFLLPIEYIQVPNPAWMEGRTDISREIRLEHGQPPLTIDTSAAHYTVRNRRVVTADRVAQRDDLYDQDWTGNYFRHHLPPTYDDAAKGRIHYPRIVAAYVAATPTLEPLGTQTGPFMVTLRFQEHYGDLQNAPSHDTSDEGLAALRAALVAGVEHGTVTGLSRLSVADASTRYQVTLEPELGFVGELTLQVPADTVVALNSNLGNLAATLTVPIDTSLQLVSGQSVEVVEPESGTYLSGDEIVVRVPFAADGLTYEGKNPPYITIFLSEQEGEQEPANARHATWQKGEERSGSTIVPFVYVLQETDPPSEGWSVASQKRSVSDPDPPPEGVIVRLDSQEILKVSLPRGTVLMSASGPDRAGMDEPAVGPGEAAPVSETPSGGITFDVPVTPVVYLPPEETDSKSVASDVPRSPVVFNELGNGSEDANDWLELRNVSGSDVSLKDWELSVVVDGKKEDTSLIVFPDVSVPANGLLLITNSAADKTPLAGGENRGLSHASLVDAGLSLPDDGKFLLILRNAKEKLGLDEAFIDVAGGGGSDTDAFVRDETGDYDTYVWPLQVLEAPGDATEDALSSGKVWQRAKADIIGYHQAAWAEAAFTGIGYDRKVTRSAATAGTPGYPNGAAKTAASTPRGAVTISEIMFDSDRGKLPQWIELYNKSKTEALNLDRWQLEIQNRNSEDLIGRPIVTLTLQEKVIQPNQTLLIVAGDARASSADVFPEDRVYNLLKLHEKNLRIKTPRDTFLSGEGFYLKLSDRNGTKIDEVGNIDDNRRTDDAPVWVWPTNRREGPRSSVVRRYDKGTSDARDGMLKSNWALSANFNRFKVESLHYGHADDIGTPGYRKGGALPVELSSFKVTRTDEGPVVVTWTTESEVDNAGFNLRRSQQRDSGFTLLNPVLIAGAGTTGERQTYTFTDTSAKPGVEYYYQIEEVSLGGWPETLRTRRLPGPVSPANRALTTFGEVKQRE